MELLHPESTRSLERENRELREELRKRHDQQRIMEQIVSNMSSLLEGANEAMCIFDKDGHFLHMNVACRRLLGLVDNQHSTRLTIFEFYTPWDRDRIMMEFFSKPTQKWNGIVNLLNKHTGYETNVTQTIEIIPNKHSMEAVFFKSYLTVQDNATSDKIRLYNDIIHHMPHGVGIWRLERALNKPAAMRLVCANKMASQCVGVSLLPGSLVHEILPNGGIEVHRFLEDVVRSQRVLALDTFRVGPHHAFSVTAYPLYPDCVVVVMDSPKNTTPLPPPPTVSIKDKEHEWVSVVSASGLAVAACEAGHALQVNEHFAAMLAVPQAYMSGRDVLAVLESRVRPGTRVFIEQLRRAIRERVVHHVEIELEQFAWRMSVHPMAEGTRHVLILAHRTRTLAPQPQSQRPMFPILPNSFPTASPSASPALSLSDSKIFETSSVFKDAIEHIPCGIVILKKEDETPDSLHSHFRVVFLNHAARALPFTKGLAQGHRFDEASSPFDTAFIRAIISSAKSQEGRVAYAVEGKAGARIVPMYDHTAILFEDSSLFEFPTIFDSPRSGTSSKRAIADLVNEVDHGYPIFPNHPPSKYMRAACKTETGVSPFQKSASMLPPLQNPFAPTSSSTINPLRNDKLERMFQHCVIGIACLDLNGAITMANKTFGQMMGYPESELSKLQQPSHLPTLAQTPAQAQCVQQIADMVHPEDAAHARGVLRQLASGEAQTMDVPLRFMHKQLHSVVWGVASFVSIEKGIMLQVLQPTRLKHFPEVLMSDRDVLRVAFKEMVVGSAILDVEDHPRIVSANNGFCAIMASVETDLAGRSLVDTLHPDDHESVLTVARDIAAARTSRSQLLSVRSNPKSGPSRYGALALSAILDSKSKPFLLVAQLQLVDKPFS